MARIAGVDIPNDKRVVVSLTYIYGVGLPTAQKVLAENGISEDIRVKDLTDEQLNAIRKTLDSYKLEGDLRRETDGSCLLPWNETQKRSSCKRSKN